MTATLALDTSTGIAVSVLDAQDQVLSSVILEDSKSHAEQLMPLIDSAVKDANLVPRDITTVVVGRGPAPFTGLRVGLVTGKTLAMALGATLNAVCSLDAFAVQAATEFAAANGNAGALELHILTCNDARRKEVYWQAHRATIAVDEAGTYTVTTLQTTAAPQVSKPDAVAALLPANQPIDLVCGSGIALYPELLAHGTEQPLSVAAAQYLAQAARLRLAAGADLSDTEPLYLREADAALPKTRKSALGPAERAR